MHIDEKTRGKLTMILFEAGLNIHQIAVVIKELDASTLKLVETET